MIRQTGAYFTDETFNRLKQDPRQMLQFLDGYREVLNKTIEKEERIKQLEPSAERFERWLNDPGLYTVYETTLVMGIKGMGLKNLFKYFRNNGFVTNKNLPFREYIELGYFASEEAYETYMQGKKWKKFKTMLTPKGINFFRDRLLFEGYISLNELARNWKGNTESVISEWVPEDEIA